MKQRYKVTVKDTEKGGKVSFYVNSLGFLASATEKDGEIQSVKIVLEHPEIKIDKENKNGK